MGTERIRNADRPGSIAPDDDLPAHPGLLDELLLAQMGTQLDEIPTVWERMQRMHMAGPRRT